MKIYEDELQEHLNSHLNTEGFTYFRIPSWFWDWLLKNAPVKMIDEIKRRWGGLPDNVVFVPVKAGGLEFTMCLLIELKSKDGKLHGKQKRWYKRLPVYIGRTKEDVKEIMLQFLSIVDVVYDLLDKKQNINDNNVLKNCPLCGAKGSLCQSELMVGRFTFSVVCTDDHCECATGLFALKKSAVDFWQNRP